MELLNLGCGSRFNESWTNIDFISNSEKVIAYNLLNGIPFKKESFDVVYHSHVLEHFTKTDGEKLLGECYRVLKKNGIIRIAVPDLEKISREYLYWLELSVKGDKEAEQNYEWIKLEMYDQVVRTQGGGDMGKYLLQEKIPNENYVFERLGEEARNIRRVHLNPKKEITTPEIKKEKTQSPSLKNRIKIFIKPLKEIVKKRLFSYEYGYIKNYMKEAELGRFRLSGEVHQWMYDRYSLAKTLEGLNFIDAEVKDAFTSNVANWNSYELESKNGVIYKPDSLFMEAKKI